MCRINPFLLLFFRKKTALRRTNQTSNPLFTVNVFPRRISGSNGPTAKRTGQIFPQCSPFVFCFLPFAFEPARSRTTRTTMQQGYYFSKTSAFDSVLPVDTRPAQRGTAPAQNGTCWSGSNTWRPNVGTNHYLTMKNPLKQQENSAASVQAGMSQATPDQPATDNFPTHFENRRPAQFATRELRSPEAESFRAFIKSRLPREKAPQALMNKIRQITKTPA